MIELSVQSKLEFLLLDKSIVKINFPAYASIESLEKEVVKHLVVERVNRRSETSSV